MKRKIVGFFSRAHGFNVLDTLVRNEQFEICKIFTNSLNPSSQDPKRGIREDYHKFVEICNEYKIELESIDSNNDKIKAIPECDFIIEVSWRFIIPEAITKKARYGAFGIHRGKLPQYGGAEPIKQALEKNEKEIIISAHFLEQEIDTGKVIDTVSHPVNYRHELSMEENIQRLRDEITPHFSILVIKTLEKLQKI